MKKYALVTISVLVAFTGCGRGWLPCLTRGSSCFSGSCGIPYGFATSAPAASVGTGCADCGGVPTVAGYEGYVGGEHVINNGVTYGAPVVQGAETVHAVPHQ